MLIVVGDDANAYGSNDLERGISPMRFEVHVGAKPRVLTNSANFSNPGTVLMYPVFKMSVELVLLVVTVRVMVTVCDILAF